MLTREIGKFLVGIMFLTRLPVPAGLAHGDGALARAARYFPLIGALVGGFVALIFFLSAQVLAPPIAAGVALAGGLLLTGALHEDGLADTLDGLGGGRTREMALEIMRDSRIGTYGAVAILLSIGLRWAALAQLTPAEGVFALIICHSVSRGMIPPVLVSSYYARSYGMASSVAKGVSGTEAAFAIAMALSIAVLMGAGAGLAAFAAAMLAAGLMLGVLVRRIGGYTGDGLGAIQQVAEIAVMITLAGMWA